MSLKLYNDAVLSGKVDYEALDRALNGGDSIKSNGSSSIFGKIF